MEAGGGSRSGITASTTPERAPPADSVRSRTPSAATSQGPSGAAMVYHHAKRVPPLLWCKQSSDRCVSPAFLASTPQALDGSVTCESVNMPKNSRKIRAVIACMCIRQSEVVFVVFIVGQHSVLASPLPPSALDPYPSPWQHVESRWCECNDCLCCGWSFCASGESLSGATTGSCADDAAGATGASAGVLRPRSTCTSNHGGHTSTRHYCGHIRTGSSGAPRLRACVRARVCACCVLGVLCFVRVRVPCVELFPAKHCLTFQHCVIRWPSPHLAS